MGEFLTDLEMVARSDETVHEAPVELAAVVESGWHTTNTAAATLVIETEQTIRADRGRVRQLLENPFRNALKHAGEDVTVVVGDPEDGFYVADDGASDSR